MSEYSDQEIDLRPYIEAVFAKWYWIVGAGVAFAVLGLIVSFMMAPTYEATALVAISEPRQRVQFDPRIQTVADDEQPVNAYPELALSDELLMEVINQLSGDNGYSLAELRGKFDAEPGGDPSILRLTVSDVDPATAAELANLWAELFVTWASQIYGDQGEDQLLFFESQLAEAEAELVAAEEALIDFQARNRSGILDNELLALQQTQADYLAKERQTDLILQDIESLLGQEGRIHSDQASIDQLASLVLQIRALGGVPGSIETTMPWQIQLNVDGQTDLSAEEQRAIISNLHDMLLAQSKQIEERLDELEPQLLSVQQQKQEANAEENRLARDYEVSDETYTALARTVEEKRITSQEAASGVKLASRTAVPEFPSGPRKAFVAIGAGLIGITLAVAAIIAITWWGLSDDSSSVSINETNETVYAEDNLAASGQKD
jgi:uncharacterized protein involved in exopolysaccharide biosynthesis